MSNTLFQRNLRNQRQSIHIWVTLAMRANKWQARAGVGNMCYHVISRGNNRADQNQSTLSPFLPFSSKRMAG